MCVLKRSFVLIIAFNSGFIQIQWNFLKSLAASYWRDPTQNM